ncbi:hypothetical protein [Nocardioides pyridinolyticus]
MTTGSPEPAPTLEHEDAVRLLREMAAVVRTVFAVDVAPSHGLGRPSAAVSAPTAPGLGGTAPVPAAPPSIPVPGMALLQEIALLDD